MRLAAGFFLILLLILPTALQAADPNEALTRAGKSLTAEKYIEAIDQLREAVQAAWDKAPLTIKNVAYVTEEPQGYGLYTPHKGETFSALEPVILYIEPIGHLAKKEGDFYHYNLSYDFIVIDQQGQPVGGQKNIKALETRSRSYQTEFMVFFTINFKGLPSGKYKLQVTLRDQNSAKTASFTKPLIIR